MQETYNRAFKGVWIPKEIWLAKDLGWTEKLLLVEIDSLDGEQGCFASNDYLANFFGLSKDRISKMISSLRDKGYITVQLLYKEGTKQIEKRIIRMARQQYPIGGNTDTPRRKQLEGIGGNTDTPIGENAKDNNTVINNTSNNTSNKKDTISGKPDSAPLPYQTIVDHLNQKIGAKYKSTSKKTQDLIKARFNEGFTLEQFLRVIDIKTTTWLHDPKMNKFLRPETLFGPKFEGYLNEKVGGNNAANRNAGEVRQYDDGINF